MKSKIKQKLVEACNRELEWETKRINKILQSIDAVPVNLIYQAFPNSNVQKDSFGIMFIMPFSFSLIEEVRLFMKMQFPEIELESDHRYVWSNSASHYLTYKTNADVKFDFQFRSGEKGSTCILNPIGKEMKEIVLYEVVCSEEAVKEFSLEENNG